MKKHITKNGILYNENTLSIYKEWDKPIVIISDGPYGINGYEGDDKRPDNLGKVYEPHIKEWSKKITPETTLWFWNTEVGWATVHPVLIENGWIYRGCNIWNKGIEHVAGNCNGKTMRKFPVVTEVCVHYVRSESFTINDNEISVQSWLRSEWQRTGLSLMKANIACGVKNAASRKYLTKDHLWYFPPKEEFAKLVAYANLYGKKEGFPYFSLNGKTSLSESQWERMRAKFNFEYGSTNVWNYPALRSKERLKDGTTISHPNQKPLELMKKIILASSDMGDIIWEPFGGTASASFAAQQLNRKFLVSEINSDYYSLMVKRFK